MKHFTFILVFAVLVLSFGSLKAAEGLVVETPQAQSAIQGVENQNVHHEHFKIDRKQRKAIRKAKRTLNDDADTLLLVIIAILLPPLAVLLVDGLTAPFWLDLLLTLLFYFPGLIYALFRIL